MEVQWYRQATSSSRWSWTCPQFLQTFGCNDSGVTAAHLILRGNASRSLMVHAAMVLLQVQQQPEQFFIVGDVFVASLRPTIGKHTGAGFIVGVQITYSLTAVLEYGLYCIRMLKMWKLYNAGKPITSKTRLNGIEGETFVFLIFITRSVHLYS